MEQIRRIQGDRVRLVSVSGDKPMKLSQINVGGGGGVRPHYQGATEFVPTQAYQTVHTAGLLVDADIVIDPIPSNYGRITWNGSFLTVS